MIGREAYRNPWYFATADRLFYNDDTYHIGSRRDVIERYLEYAENALKKGGYGNCTHTLSRPLHNFFSSSGKEHNVQNSAYKAKLHELLLKHAHHIDKGEEITFTDVIRQAMEDTIPESFLDEEVTN